MKKISSLSKVQSLILL